MLMYDSILSPQILLNLQEAADSRKLWLHHLSKGKKEGDKKLSDTKDLYFTTDSLYHRKEAKHL